MSLLKLNLFLSLWLLAVESHHAGASYVSQLNQTKPWICKTTVPIETRFERSSKKRKIKPSGVHWYTRKLTLPLLSQQYLYMYYVLDTEYIRTFADIVLVSIAHS